jgi:hypothetical protein
LEISSTFEVQAIVVFEEYLAPTGHARSTRRQFPPAKHFSKAFPSQLDSGLVR